MKRGQPTKNVEGPNSLAYERTVGPHVDVKKNNLFRILQ
jgi:hypothetical protein